MQIPWRVLPWEMSSWSARKHARICEGHGKRRTKSAERAPVSISECRIDVSREKGRRFLDGRLRQRARSIEGGPSHDTDENISWSSKLDRCYHRVPCRLGKLFHLFRPDLASFHARLFRNIRELGKLLASRSTRLPAPAEPTVDGSHCRLSWDRALILIKLGAGRE